MDNTVEMWTSVWASEGDEDDVEVVYETTFEATPTLDRQCGLVLARRALREAFDAGRLAGMSFIQVDVEQKYRNLGAHVYTIENVSLQTVADVDAALVVDPASR